jgi:SAM-dependent methyltransferase
VLDAGYAFAEAAWLEALAPFEPVGVDLAEAEVAGYRSVRADLRELPFENASFDVAFCVSTLEHVGRDNSLYGVGAEDDPVGMQAALGELRRVVAGRVLISVPAGAREDHGWFVQLEPAAWLELFRDAGFLVFEHELYELDRDGWRAVVELAPVRYRERGPAASGLLCAELRPATLRGRLRALRARG